MTRDELEAALADHFDADHLEVYGDYLQGQGDPRGELIALDLSELDDYQRRPRTNELLAAWLGDDAVELLGLSTVEHGFVTDLYLDDHQRGDRLLDMILAGPAAPYVRGATIRGNPAFTRRVVARLATQRHGWLERLSIQAFGGRDAVVIGSELLDALRDATPRLEQLEVWGRRALGELDHPTIRSLCVTGYDGVRSLLGKGPARLPALELLDLAFHVEDDRSEVDPRALASMLVVPGKFPALRRLDLSRNEPGTRAPHYLGGEVDTFGFLARLAIRGQLTHVRAPSVRTQADADQISDAILRMPVLRELAIVRGYRRLADRLLPPIVKLPALWPWYPADVIEPYVRLRLYRDAAVPPERVQLPLSPLVIWLEHRLDHLPPAVRAAWRSFFAVTTERTGRDLDHVLPRQSLAVAFAALDEHDPTLADWIQLRTALQRTPAAVGVDRYSLS